MRNVRRDGMEALKTDEKKDEISEDERKRHETEVQKMTDETISGDRRRGGGQGKGNPPASDLPVGQERAAAGSDGRRRGRFPRHVAIIMDGNGRWAKARGLPRARRAIAQGVGGGAQGAARGAARRASRR